MALTISSAAFPPGGEIPKRFTCDGAGPIAALVLVRDTHRYEKSGVDYG